MLYSLKTIAINDTITQMKVAATRLRYGNKKKPLSRSFVRWEKTEEGSIISLIRDPVALINNPLPDRDNDDIHVPNKPLLPPVGRPVEVIIQFPQPRTK